MEQLMIKAIREFKKQHSDAEIRVVYVLNQMTVLRKYRARRFALSM